MTASAPLMFNKKDVRKLFQYKKVIFLGDSIMRDIYKDFIWLYDRGTLISHEKIVDTNDKEANTVQRRLTGTERLVPDTGLLTRGRGFREEREYHGTKDHPTLSRFYFLSRCWSGHLKQFLLKVKKEDRAPDLIVVLSCLWDINRYGPDGIKKYKENCPRLLRFIDETFERDVTQLVWLTCPPISASDVNGGVFTEEIDFLKPMARFLVLEANTMVSDVTAAHGFDVLDLHYFLQLQLQLRRDDGVHWSARGLRLMVNILLSHFSVSRDLLLPGQQGKEEKVEEMF